MQKELVAVLLHGNSGCSRYGQADTDFGAQGGSKDRVGKAGGGAYARDPTESLSLLINEHFPGNKPHNETDPIQPTYPEQGERLEDVSWITPTLVRAAFKSFGPNKAAGPDGFKPLALQHLPISLIERISTVYCACIQLGYTPEVWRKSNVIFLPKPNKPDYTQVRAFRPISLMPFLCKGIERLVYWRLEATALRTHPLHHDQHAFRKGGFCTETILSAVIHKIEKAFSANRMILMAFLDLQGAFDNINVDKAIAQMEHHGWEKPIRTWYSHYLKNRTGLFDINGVQSACDFTKGTPEGGILSPLLFIICIDTLLRIYDQSQIDAKAYADDSSLATEGVHAQRMADRVTLAVDRAVEWGVEYGLEFSKEKTKVILFSSHPRAASQQCEVTMQGTILPLSTQTRHLGVILTNNLDWTPHILSKIKAAKALLATISTSLGRLWGPNPYLMRWAYTSIIRPRLTYGSFVWAHAVVSKPLIQSKLRKLQRMAMLPVACIRPSTPTAGLEVILLLPPLHLLLQELSIRTFLRIHSHLKLSDAKWLQPNRSHLTWCREHARRLQIKTDSMDVCCKTPNTDRTFEIDTESFSSESHRPGTGICCYTDGSRIPGEGTGAGFYITFPTTPSISRSYALGDDATVFQAELTAIEKSAQYLLNRTTPFTPKIDIYCDSQAAILALDAQYVQSTTVISCVALLNRLSSLSSVTIHWIKAHVDHRGNELADRAAKRGTRANLDPDPSIEVCSLPIAKAIIDRIIQDDTYDRWQYEWETSPHYRQTKIFFPGIAVGASRSLIKLHRDALSRVIRWTTGHCFLRYHSTLVRTGSRTDDANKCRKCRLSPETASHILLECDAFALTRLQAFGSTEMDPDDFEWEPHNLCTMLDLISHMEEFPTA
jgi:ribonuclease HI